MNHDKTSEIIIPAIMPFHQDDVKKLSERVVDHVGYVQIDFMDGVFVPQASWPYEDGIFSLSELETLENVIKNNPSLKFEADLMVESSLSLAPHLVKVGFHRIIFHYKTLNDPIEIEQFAGEFPDVEIGIAIHVDDSVEALLPYKKFITTIQCMGIEKVGFQKQAFTEESLKIITGAHNIFPEIPIQVDGGVSVDTVGKMSLAGAYRFVSGSAVFDSEDVPSAIIRLAEKI